MEDLEDTEEEIDFTSASSSSAAVVKNNQKRAGKKSRKPSIDEEVDGQKPRRHYFHPSRYQSDLLSFFRTGGSKYMSDDAKPATFDHLQPHTKKDLESWAALDKDDKIPLINDIVKLIVMRVHNGQTILDASTINDFLKSKGKKISHKTVLYFSRLPLLRLFGYEIVPCFEPGEDNMLVIRDGQYIVRLSSRAAGDDGDKAAERLQRHEVDLFSRGKTDLKFDKVTDRAAARRGLLMAVLTFIIGTTDLKIPESDLFANILRLDRRLPPPTGKGSGAAAISRGKSSLDADNNDDFEDLGEMKDWIKIIRDDFIAEKYLEFVKLEGSAEAAAAAAAEGTGAPGRARDAYTLGVRGRAVLGALGIYEYGASLHEMDAVSGASKVIAPEQTPSKDAVATLLKMELGDFVKSLPASVLAKKAADAAGITIQADESGEEVEGGDGVQEQEDEEAKEQDNDEDEEKKKKKKTKKRKSRSNDDDVD
jgi:hypothetical protein